ncbi:MAG: SAM-dependent methyltransferase [Oscillospiraceae bacterium]|nr:SAM-dependent methyltransferase [Oscillospiraceae bacterium]
MIRLSPRLSAVAALVPQGAHVADVGTDHGYLAVYLISTGIADSVVATDIREGPLTAAKQNIEGAGLSGRIELRLCDGLAGVQPDEADTVVIAGMGGETIAGILSRSPWALEKDRLLILSPQSKPELLRAWLYEHGCGVRSEHLVRDAGRIYPILCAEGAPDRKPKAAELLMGYWPPETRGGVFREALRRNIEKLRREAEGLRAATTDRAAAQLRETESLLAELEEWEGQL